jgi:hypothetical protein
VEEFISEFEGSDLTRWSSFTGLREGTCDKPSYGRNSHVTSRNDGLPNPAQTERRGLKCTCKSGFKALKS